MTRISASSSKITRPSFPECLPRKRLFRQLDLGRRRPIIWVSGPPGSGKTTLVGSYFDARKIPCLWYRLDEGDADIATFFYYLGLAARKAAPGRRKALPLLTPEYLPGIAVFTRRYFEKLLSRLRPGSVLVFDDCQTVPDGSPFFEILREGLSLLPDGMNAVMVSRGDPPPVLSRLRANGLMELIGWQLVRLTAEETGGIVRIRRKRKLPAGTIRHLHGRTDGWAAGLLLLLEKPEIGELKPPGLGKMAPGALFDYFASEVFDTLEEETRNFLLKTAFFPVMTTRMAERLTGHGRAGQILSGLNRHNYFTEKHSHAEPAYKYHSLFREFLRARSEEVFPAAEVLRIKQLTATVLEEFADVEEAVSLFREANAWGDLVRVILTQAATLVGQGRSHTLLEWLNALPREALEQEPWLRYWLGVCRLILDPRESLQYFEDAFHEFRARRNIPGAYLAWSGIVESIAVGFESFKLLDGWIAVLDGMMEEYNGFPSEEIEARVTLSMIKCLALRMPPNYSAMETWASRAAAVAGRSADASPKTEILISLAAYRILRGDLRQADAILAPLRKLVTRPDVPPLPRLFFYWEEAAYAMLTAMHGRCMDAVGKGLALSRFSGVHVMDSFLMGTGALSSLNAGDIAAAEKFLHAMESSPRPLGPLEISKNCHIAAWIALLRGETAKALAHAEQGVKLTEEIGFPVGHYVCCLASAFIFHESGNFEKAAQRLSEAERIGAEQNSDLISFSCLLTRTYIALGGGDETSSRALLREGLRIGRERGFMGLDMYRPELLGKIAGKALEAGIEVRYVQDLIRRNALLPDSANMLHEEWPWPVRIHTLGRFELIRDGKPVPASPKTQKKPLVMLKTLIALGGRDIAAEQLTDALWPDADGDLATKSFSVTLFRLRRLLGLEKVLLLRDGRLTLDRRYCWVDAWALEQTLENAGISLAGRMSALNDGAIEPGAVDRSVRRSLALYKGPFLAGDSSCPALGAYRERLRGRLLKLMDGAGSFWESAGEWERAAACYESGLELDDLTEQFYQRLMTCCLRLGRISDGVVAYRRCRQTLSSSLGVNPSPKTEAIYRSLLSV